MYRQRTLVVERFVKLLDGRHLSTIGDSRILIPPRRIVAPPRYIFHLSYAEGWKDLAFIPRRSSLDAALFGSVLTAAN